MNNLNRRHFIQAALGSLAMVPLAGFCHVDRHTFERAPVDYFFFDDRYGTARLCAEGWPAGTRVVSVGSDVTEVWQSFLSTASRSGPLTLQGVTTESFHFCLKVLMAEGAHVDSQITRLDRDLYQWTIRSGGQGKQAASS